MNREKLLEIRGMKTRFKIGKEWATAVNGIDFDIFKGETLGIVGESGSGKSVSVLSLIQLIPNPPGEVSEGTIRFRDEVIFDGNNLKDVNEKPEFKYFQYLKGTNRSWASRAFFLSWLFLHAVLPIPGILLFLVSLVANILITTHLFFNSPRKKAFNMFRESMYKRMRDFRGKEIAMIFQEPMTSLNPVFSVGMQVMESIHPKSFSEFVKDSILSTALNLNSVKQNFRIKISFITGLVFVIFSQLGLGWTFYWQNLFTFFLIGSLFPTLFAFAVLGLCRIISQEYKDAYEKLFSDGTNLLRRVGIPDAEKRMSDYPHHFSGGMRQRAMIAMALAKNPSLLIADEPTTALDVTIQAQILDLMLELKNENDEAAVILITHDMAVVAETCERVIVMYGGVIQEVAPVEHLFEEPYHPYTKGLLNSIPHPDEYAEVERLDTISGMVPNILDLPEGCKFCTRCDLVEDRCHTDEPPLVELSPDHFVRCHVIAEGGSNE